MKITSTKTKTPVKQFTKISSPSKVKLTDNKKYVKPESKEVRDLKKEIKNTPKPRLTAAKKAYNEARGLY